MSQLLNRRDFLALGGALPFALPIAMGPFNALAQLQRTPNWNRTLILIELKGGNDGLNTIIPHGDPNYYRLRPRLGIPKHKVIQLTPQLGLHPSLSPLKSLWEGGAMAIVSGVGYPKPNLSHFRSIEIWDTASDSNKYLDQGWIAQVFADSKPPASLLADGVILGRDDAEPLYGQNLRTVSLRDPRKFLKQTRHLRPSSAPQANPSLAHILSVQNQLHQTAAKFREQNFEAASPGAAFPKHSLGKQLKTAAQLIASGLSLPVIKVSLGGFDTHANQAGTHARLLKQWAEAVTAFSKAMQSQGRWDDVMMMTYSEFGRRPVENGSRGTDHGTAAPHLILGGRVRGGFYGRQPSLTALQGKNLMHHVHFRQLYATAAQEWMGLPARSLGARPLGLIRG
jgi:uncharacterized protein (DUF1501 family)